MSALDTRQGGADDNDAQAGHLVIGGGSWPTMSEEQVPSLTGRKGDQTAVFNPARTLQKDGTVTESFKPDEITDALHGPTGNKEPLVMAPAFSKRPGQQIATREDGLSYALSTGEPPRLSRADLVRRLTPLECERLQGFPDGWTEGESDSTRYRMLGNAVCVPVAEWIGRRLYESERGLTE